MKSKNLLLLAFTLTFTLNAGELILPSVTFSQKSLPSIELPNDNSRGIKTERLDSLDLGASKYAYTYDSRGNMLGKVTENMKDGVWTKSYKLEYIYNSKDKVTTSFSYSWVDGSWEGGTKMEFTYNVNGTIRSQIDYLWENGHWGDYDSKYEYSYDETGNQIEELFSQRVAGNWVKVSREITTYVDNQEVSSIDYDWIENKWIETSKHTFTYNEAGEWLTSISYSKEGTAWVGKSRYVRLFDFSGRLISRTVYDWSGDTWVDGYSKLEVSYADEGRLITVIEYNSQNSVWVESIKNVYHHDENGNETIFALFKWVNGVWIGHLKDIYVYDLGVSMDNVLMDERRLFVNKPLSRDTYFWNVTTGTWAITPRFNGKYYYSSLATSNIVQNSISPSGIRWTQNNNSLTLSNINNSSLSAQIFSMNGRLVGEFELNQSLSIDLSSYAPAAYLLQLRSDFAAVKTIKFMVR